MSVYRDNSNGYDGKKWSASIRYVDWTGRKKQHTKRGFSTKREALEYEREFKAKMTKNINMGFSTFIDLYMNDRKPQLKQSTYNMKLVVIDTHIRPYFENKALSEITAVDILQWQNTLLQKRDEHGKGYSQTYLRTIQRQMNAIFNHAVRYYDLPKNPCHANALMGKEKANEMLFWTQEEYLKFSDAVKDKPVTYYAFQMLYWMGIRCGELLALTQADFDFEHRILDISKSLQVIKGKEVITSPKTEKSNRKIDIPEFLCDEMKDYFDSLYKVTEDMRIFPVRITKESEGIHRSF